MDYEKWNSGYGRDFLNVTKQKSRNTMNPEELKALKRHELQEKAKELGIKANQSSQEIIDQLLEKYV